MTKRTLSRRPKTPRPLPYALTAKAKKQAAKSAPKPVPAAATPAPEPEEPTALDLAVGRASEQYHAAREVLPFINFDGTTNPEAPIELLVATMLDAGFVEGFEGPAALLANALVASADEAALIGSLNDHLDHSHNVERVLMRGERRSRLIVEIARRMAAKDGAA